jgi:hypothetical protein
VFFAALYFVTLSESSATCTVCHDFGGGSSCDTVSAPDRDQAIAQAVSTACAKLAGGVTQTMECTRTPSRQVSCSE